MGNLEMRERERGERGERGSWPLLVRFGGV